MVMCSVWKMSVALDKHYTGYQLKKRKTEDYMERDMGAGTGGAGWASAHPGKNQGGHGPPWKF